MSYKMVPIKKHIEVESLVSVYYFEYTDALDFPGEAHDFWELLYVDMGTVEAAADHTPHRLGPGEMIFHQPMEHHTLKATGKGAVAVIVISFVCHSPAMQAFRRRKCPLLPGERALLAGLLEECGRAFSSPLHFSGGQGLVPAQNAPAGALQLVGAGLEALLLQLLRRFGPVPEAAGEHTTPAARQATPALSQINAYLAQRVAENLTVEQIARDNFISRSRLQGMFKKEYGHGVMEAFHHLKAAQAKILLRSGHSCGEVALRLGYGTADGFAKRFKAATGFSPQAYAKSVQAHTLQVGGAGKQDAPTRVGGEAEQPG